MADTDNAHDTVVWAYQCYAYDIVVVWVDVAVSAVDSVHLDMEVLVSAPAHFERAAVVADFVRSVRAVSSVLD